MKKTNMVVDHTAPTISGQGSNGTVECPASPTFTAPTASDTCGGATVHDLGATTTAGTCGNIYTSTKSWNATDDCGNTSGTVTQTIIVVDPTLPSIGGQCDNGTVECPASPTFTAPTASDTSGRVTQPILVVDHTVPSIVGQGDNGTVECPVSPSFTLFPSSDTCGGATVNDLGATTTAGTCGNTYTSTKSWNATDDCGNTSGTVTQTIMVVDHTAPTIGGQGDNGTVECPARPTFTAPTASDTCGGATVHRSEERRAAGGCGARYTSAAS